MRNAGMSISTFTLGLDITNSNSPLSFETSGGGSWPVWHRYISLNGQPAFEIGNICNTCEFFFERKEGANAKVEIAELASQLALGLKKEDRSSIEALSEMIPLGSYQVHLLEVYPNLIELGSNTDYFVSEQQRVWGLDGFWGLPHYPKTPYYRSGDRSLSKHSRLFEFIIPMYPENWLNSDRLEAYLDIIREGKMPTAVSLSVLDVKAPADSLEEEYEHWCLAHYLLDGHHKMAAAAKSRSPITMVSFIAVEHGVSSKEDVMTLGRNLDFY